MSIDLLQFAILALAIFRLTRLVTTDTIFNGLRERIWNKFPPNKVNIGYLITCDWCTSMWVAAGYVPLALLFPQVIFVVSLVLATSAVVGILAARF